MDGALVRVTEICPRPTGDIRGVVVEVVAWPREATGRRHALHRVETADGVVVSSRLLTVGDTQAVRRRTPRLAFDLDDALWFRDSARGANSTLNRRRRFKRLVRRADLVLAGNAYLAALDDALQAVRAWAPDILFVSVGLDGYEHDPLEGFRLTTGGFARIAQALGELGLPTVLVQEGGYNVPDIGANIVSFLDGFMAGRGA